MSDEGGGSGGRGRPQGGTIHPVKRTVLVDGNNVMGSRPDGWWRNRAGAAERLVAEIAPLARSSGGAWTIVFDGPAPPGMVSPHEGLAVVHAGRARRDDADDRIVELVGSLPDSGGGTGLHLGLGVACPGTCVGRRGCGRPGAPGRDRGRPRRLSPKRRATDERSTRRRPRDPRKTVSESPARLSPFGRRHSQPPEATVG